jgi:hypothetical protein
MKPREPTAMSTSETPRMRSVVVRRTSLPATAKPRIDAAANAAARMPIRPGAAWSCFEICGNTGAITLYDAASTAASVRSTAKSRRSVT